MIQCFTTDKHDKKEQYPLNNAAVSKVAKLKEDEQWLRDHVKKGMYEPSAASIQNILNYAKS